MQRGADRRDEPAPRARRIGSAGRLATLHGALLALVLGVVVVALVRSFTSSYEAAAARGLGSQLVQFQRGASVRPVHVGLRPFAIGFLQSHPLPAGGAVVIGLRGAGLVVTGDTRALVRDPRIRAWLATPPRSTTTLSGTYGGVPLEVVVSPLVLGTTPVGTYVAASDLTPFVAQRSRVLRLSLAEATIALLVGAASAFFLLRRLLRRVGRITTTAGQISSGALEQRLGAPPDADEVGELARTFDVMLDQLDASMRAQRRLLADVSHQLRTPVTVVRGHLEVLHRTGDADLIEVRETLDVAIDELDHMASMIERLLTLGRAMESDLLVKEPAELRSVLAPAVESARVLAPAAFELGAVPSVWVAVDTQQLRGAISNLLDNAARVVEPGGTVRVTAAGGPPGGIAIFVEDTGPGIPEAQREAVTERFARPGARDEDGSGLGLAIAKAVAVAHGGKLAIDRSPELGGARVAIELPASAVVRWGP